MSRSFTDAVRNKEISQPHQRTFKIENWDAAFNKLKNSAQDERLYNSGSWFSAQFEAVRRRLQQLPSLDSVANIRLIVATANHQSALAMVAPTQATEKETFFPHRLLDSYEPIGPSKAPTNRAAYIEGLVSALSLPLRTLLRVQKIGNSSISPASSLRELGAHIQLAATYSILETWWMDCLWNQWYVKIGQNGARLLPSDLKQHASHIVGQFRTQMLSHEFVLHATATWNDPRMERYRAIQLSRAVKAEVGKRGKLTIRPLTSEERRSPLPPLADIILVSGEELYWNDLLIRALPNFGGLTIRQLLSALQVVMAIGHALDEQFRSLPDFEHPRHLANAYAPHLTRQDLIRTLAASSIPRHQRERVLGLFTFDGDKQIDPWLHPLVPSGDGFTLLVSAASSPNPIRFIEHWMQQGGLSLDERGRLFENYVANEVDDAFNNCRFSDLCRRSNAGIKFKPLIPQPADSDAGAREHEEVDLVLLIGNYLLVCEAKCCMFPTEPIEYFGYRQRVLGGREQASRKANFIKSHISEFLGRYFQGYQGDPAEVRVFPLVITNLPFGSDPYVSPPVLDLHLLRRYFDPGNLGPPTMVSPDGGVAEMKEPTPFYVTAQDFVANLPIFLFGPPVLSAYARSLLPQIIYTQLGDGSLAETFTLRVDGELVERHLAEETQKWSTLRRRQP